MCQYEWASRRLLTQNREKKINEKFSYSKIFFKYIDMNSINQFFVSEIADVPNIYAWKNWTEYFFSAFPSKEKLRYFVGFSSVTMWKIFIRKQESTKFGPKFKMTVNSKKSLIQIDCLFKEIVYSKWPLIIKAA